MSRRFLGLLAAAGALLALPASAQAGLLVQEASPCVSRSMDQVFMPFLDVAHYVEAPGGRAESNDSWKLTGGAGVVEGQQEPWRVAGADDDAAMRIPSGGSATTSAMCVGIEYPTLRFFSKSSGTSLLGSALYVDVLVEDTLGLISALPVTAILPHSSWSPGLPYVLVPSLLPLLPGSLTPVSFRFRAVGPGTWHVDDVHVDPYKRG